MRWGRRRLRTTLGPGAVVATALSGVEDPRRAYLTYFAGVGVPDVVLAAWAGHANGGTLAKRVYAHSDNSHLKMAADHLETGPFGPAEILSGRLDSHTGADDAWSLRGPRPLPRM